MAFNSWQYAFLLLGCFALYWRLPVERAWGRRARLWLLLAASYTFYGFWDVRFLALILASTVADYFCTQAIAGLRSSSRRLLGLALLPALWLALCRWVLGLEGVSGTQVIGTALAGLGFAGGYGLLWQQAQRRGEGFRRRAFLWLSVGLNLSLLGFFKYFGFFAQSLVDGLAVFGVDPGWLLPNVLLPVGISFYTFQSLSFSVDVYRQKAQPTEDFVLFATYIGFFPQLVAGPIERPAHLLPQLERPARLQPEDLFAGSRLILTGLFKKVFVADNCAILANYAFDPSTSLNLPWALIGVLAFAFQIYGDFSGYTDMARGSARLFGVRLVRNFQYPYSARGPSDFWQRWHISLSSWFRDYVYIPLGGNRAGAWVTARNLGITMFLAGLWHGAAWTFVVWGLYHGLLLVLYHSLAPLRALESSSWEQGWRRALAVSLMFVLTLFGWVIFRSSSLDQVADWVWALGVMPGPGAVDWLKPLRWLLIHILPLLVMQWLMRESQNEASMQRLSPKLRVFSYMLLIFLVVSSGQANQEFIYFQF